MLERNRSLRERCLSAFVDSSVMSKQRHCTSLSHFPELGALPAVCAQEHADHIVVKVEGPFKGDRHSLHDGITRAIAVLLVWVRASVCLPAQGFPDFLVSRISQDFWSAGVTRHKKNRPERSSNACAGGPPHSVIDNPAKRVLSLLDSA